MYRIVSEIDKTLHEKEYCSAAFLYLSQAFDKVWHKRLLFKMKLIMPESIFVIFQSYVTDSKLFINIWNFSIKTIKCSTRKRFKAYYFLNILIRYNFTPPNTYIATFENVVQNENSITPSRYLQEHLLLVEKWLIFWKMEVFFIIFKLLRGQSISNHQQSALSWSLIIYQLWLHVASRTRDTGRTLRTPQENVS